MKICGLTGLIITNGSVINFKYWKLGILGIQVMILDLMDFRLDQLVSCQSKDAMSFLPLHGGVISGLKMFKNTFIDSVLSQESA